MEKLEEFWEQRSEKYGTKIEGVLLKSVPAFINDYLHQWMLGRVSDEVENKENIQILDIGCGYGRLSNELLKKFSKIKTSGVDISQKYVDLYNQQLRPRGQAFKSDVCKLPFKDNEFEMVFIVTTLMYLSKYQDQMKAFKEISRVLKPGGQLIVIERNPLGYRLFNLGGLIPLLRGKKNSEIPAVSFTPSVILEFMENTNIRLLKKQGIPLFTLFFFPILIVTLLNKYLGALLLKMIKNIDKIFSQWVSPSLYIVYKGVKDEA